MRSKRSSLPSVTRLARISPLMGPMPNPWPLSPAPTTRPGFSGTASNTGSASGVRSISPPHTRSTRRSAKPGKIFRALRVMASIALTVIPVFEGLCRLVSFQGALAPIKRIRRSAVWRAAKLPSATPNTGASEMDSVGAVSATGHSTTSIGREWPSGSSSFGE